MDPAPDSDAIPMQEAQSFMRFSNTPKGPNRNKDAFHRFELFPAAMLFNQKPFSRQKTSNKQTAEGPNEAICAGRTDSQTLFNE
jgi:hypothetical protein